MNNLPGEIIQYIVERSQATHRLTPQDLRVWEKFQALLSANYAYPRFDVRLGSGRDPGPDAQEHEKRMWEALTQYRTDVCILTEDVAWLIELKPSVTPGMLGQLLAYRDAMRNTPLDNIHVQLIGLAETGHKQVTELASTMEIYICSLDNPRSLVEVFGSLVTPGGAR